MPVEVGISTTRYYIPILTLRNSVMWIEEKDYEKWNNLGFNIENIFLSTSSLEKMYVTKAIRHKFVERKIISRKSYRSISKRTNDHSVKSFIKSDYVKRHLNL